MKVLVATTETQGMRDDDFCWTVDGELVYVPFATCASPTCGCDRAFAGVASSKPTTTAAAVERGIDASAYTTALRDGLARQGWTDGGSASYERWLADLVRLHRDLAGAFPHETIVEVRDGHVCPRIAQPW